MHVGLDAHKKNTVGFVVHANGKREGPFTLKTTREDIDRLATRLRNGTVYVEASTTGKGVVRRLQKAGVNAIMVHPDALMMTLRRKKNDNEDALHLALVGQVGGIHAAYLATEYEDQLRCLTRRRCDNVTRVTALRNQAHAILARNLIPPPAGKLTRIGIRRRWERVDLPAVERSIMLGIFREIEFVGKEIDALGLEIHAATKSDPLIKRLLTIPGMNVINAAMIRGEYGDFARFSSGKKMASYAGIVPPNWQSGEREVHGRITRKGSPFLRNALVECIHQTKLYKSPLQRAYARMRSRVGNKKAIVAVARKLVHVIFAMMTKNQDYRDGPKDLAELKQWRHTTMTKLIDEGRREDATALLNVQNIRRDRDLWQRRAYGV